MLTLGPSLDETVVSELVPPAARRTAPSLGAIARCSRSAACGRASTPATARSRPSTGSTSTSIAARSWASSASPAAARASPPCRSCGSSPSPGRIEAGEILFDGQNLLTLSGETMRKVRGNRISMIFQQPTSSLNPVWDVGRQIGEVLEIHRGMKGTAAEARALELLRMVGIPDPERRLKAYPHEMSGGMAQRVMIAMALACEPELLIADEPTTALDVTIQAQILDLMRNLRDETGTAIILITHDLGVVAEMCDRVAVMYAGEIVEHTDVTHALPRARAPIHAGPDRVDPGRRRRSATSSRVIPGNVPNLIDLPAGCRFAPRCLAAGPRRTCRSRSTSTRSCARSGPSHEVRCWLYHDVDGELLPRAETPTAAHAGGRAADARASDRHRSSRVPGRAPRRRATRPLVEVRDLVKHFPVQRRHPAADRRPRSRPSTA